MAKTLLSKLGNYASILGASAVLSLGLGLGGCEIRKPIPPTYPLKYDGKIVSYSYDTNEKANQAYQTLINLGFKSQEYRQDSNSNYVPERLLFFLKINNKEMPVSLALRQSSVSSNHLFCLQYFPGEFSRIEVLPVNPEIQTIRKGTEVELVQNEYIFNFAKCAKTRKIGFELGNEILDIIISLTNKDLIREMTAQEYLKRLNCAEKKWPYPKIEFLGKNSEEEQKSINIEKDIRNFLD